MTPPTSYRPIALIVAGAFFMEQMDSTVIATSLPQMALSLGVDPLRMNLAIVCYLLSLVVFIPASGVLADRYGTRTVFRAAIALFTLSSVFCGLSTSLPWLLVGRVLQGLSGAMMVPVGRLIMLRSVEKSKLIEAMAWVLMPAMLGPLLGPPLGGFITTYFSWHWIFFINVPVGLAGLVLATRYIPQIHMRSDTPMDWVGLLLSGVSLATLIYGLELFSQGGQAPGLVPALLAVGLASGAGYAWHARRHAHPALDFSLARIQTFNVALIAGTFIRTGFGALPFLLPLMLQVGLGMSALQSGLAMLASGIAALLVKGASVRILRRFGYRQVLVWNGALCSLSLALCALFQPWWPIAAVSAILLIGGVARSLQYNVYGTFAYADVPQSRMSSATSLYSTFQQLAATLGVSLSVWVLEASLRVSGHSALQRSDFCVAFIAVAVVAAISVPLCARLPANAGHELSGPRGQPRLKPRRAP
jgi:EmrB/QacA subfamily drug resistance transporter